MADLRGLTPRNETGQHDYGILEKNTLLDIQKNITELNDKLSTDDYSFLADYRQDVLDIVVLINELKSFL